MLKTMRKLISISIPFVGFFGSIAALWQIVRFFQGKVGVAEPYASLEAYLTTVLGPSFVGHYIFGIASWLTVALIVAGAAYALDRILDVGWHQFLAEEKAAHDARVRHAQEIEDTRERRRVARNWPSPDAMDRLAYLERRVAELEANRG